MESTFKKKYQTVNTPDGNLEIRWKGTRFSAPLMKLFIIFWFFGMVASVMTFVMSKSQGLPGLCVAAFAYLFYWINAKKHLILVTKEGLIFDANKRLAFKDIQSIGVAEVLTHARGNIAQNYHVECKALGQSISITKPMSDSAISHGICKEISDRMSA